MNVELLHTPVELRPLSDLAPDSTFIKPCVSKSLAGSYMGPYWLLRDGTCVNLTRQVVEGFEPDTLVVEVRHEGALQIHIPRGVDIVSATATSTPAASTTTVGVEGNEHAAGTPSDSAASAAVTPGPSSEEVAESEPVRPSMPDPWVPLASGRKGREQADKVRNAYHRLCVASVNGVFEGTGIECAQILAAARTGWNRVVASLEQRGAVQIEALGGRKRRYRLHCLLPEPGPVDVRFADDEKLLDASAPKKRKAAPVDAKRAPTPPRRPKANLTPGRR